MITNTHRHVINPKLTVEKITLTPEVPVGEITSFLIRVTNDGDCDLSDVYVKELKYDGLVYDHFTDKSGKWIFDGNDKWILNAILAKGESAEFIVFFKTFKLGNFTNIIAAGSNLTNETTTHNITKTYENNTSNGTDTNDTKYIPVKPTEGSPGNPIIVLIISLMGLLISYGYRKK